MNKYHEDKMRLTKSSLEETFKNFKEVKIEEIGNFYSIILDIIRDKIMFIKHKPLRVLFYIPYILLTMLLPLVKANDKKHVSGYFVKAIK